MREGTSRGYTLLPLWGSLFPKGLSVIGNSVPTV